MLTQKCTGWLVIFFFPRELEIKFTIHHMYLLPVACFG